MNRFFAFAGFSAMAAPKAACCDDMGGCPVVHCVGMSCAACVAPGLLNNSAKKPAGAQDSALGEVHKSFEGRAFSEIWRPPQNGLRV